MPGCKTSVKPNTTSLPVRGAWIEIMYNVCYITHISSLPVRGAWIEISFSFRRCSTLSSLPVRGAWIEILLPDGFLRFRVVAPRAGSVD